MAGIGLQVEFNMSVIENRIEITTEQDKYYDYCLWEYDPVATVQNKFRSVNLLYHSFKVAGVDDRIYDICNMIREEIGQFCTVWGVKTIENILSWEFYFYDYRRLERKNSITKLLKIIEPYVKCDLRFKEQRPYFMFSIELDDDLVRGQRDMKEIDVYLGNIGSNVSSGICYSLTHERLELDNFYFFFDAKKEWEDICGKIACSVHLDLPRLKINEIIWPELTTCQTIVVANKKHNDGIYFSRINVDQLLFFLKRVGYPVEITSFIETNREFLDHLLYDVGYDYIMQDGKISILKSSYYGYF